MEYKECKVQSTSSRPPTHRTTNKNSEFPSLSRINVESASASMNRMSFREFGEPRNLTPSLASPVRPESSKTSAWPSPNAGRKIIEPGKKTLGVWGSGGSSLALGNVSGAGGEGSVFKVQGWAGGPTRVTNGGPRSGTTVPNDKISGCGNYLTTQNHGGKQQESSFNTVSSDGNKHRAAYYHPNHTHRNPRTSSNIGTGNSSTYTNNKKTPSPNSSRSSSPTPSTSSLISLSSTSPSHNARRSNHDLLKTSLRKKACLYECGTSHAVAIVTWLCGKYLAEKIGFFHRQLLQANVHHCLKDLIDSNYVTKTKVNRCMQIVLNSCFHYIIPSPDGKIETGEQFIVKFRSELIPEERPLLEELCHPWTNILNNLGGISENLVTPALPQNPQIPPNPQNQHHKHINKNNEVTLCFNDNVRCSSDVMLAQNEFIRDMARSAEIKMTEEDWRLFFATTDGVGSSALACSLSPQASTAGSGESFSSIASTPCSNSNSNISLNTLSSPTSAALSPATSLTSLSLMETSGSSSTDTGSIAASSDGSNFCEGLNQAHMNRRDLDRFRTSYCEKKYVHDHQLCAFAHDTQNNAWLRRNPYKYDYCGVMCGKVVKKDGFVINSCELGVRCGFCHSFEERDYHPDNYMKIPCERGHSCQIIEICPFIHRNNSFGTYSSPLSTSAPSPQGGGRDLFQKIPDAKAPPPINTLFVGKAPETHFERNLKLPGLIEIYRHQANSSFENIITRTGSDVRINQNDVEFDNTSRSKSQGGPSSYCFR